MTNAILMQGLVAGAFAASLSAASHAVPDTGLLFSDLYVGVGTAPVPKVSEKGAAPNGTTTGYDWHSDNDSGIQVAVTSLNGRAHRWGGWVWGAEAELGLYDITPTEYDVGGVTFVSNTNSTLAYRSLGFNVLGGYEYGIMKDDGLSAFCMILPFVGGGGAMADSEMRVGNANTKNSGFGYYGEYGIRALGCITERSWIGGVSIGYVRSTAKVKVAVDPYESELVLKRSGITFGAVAGYRF